jgi:serine phosphatase RsbU (regulator of sigma subunit)
MSYEEATIDLQPGDVLVAFTDGVTEAMNRGEEEFGEERLKELLQQGRGSARRRDFRQDLARAEELDRRHRAVTT